MVTSYFFTLWGTVFFLVVAYNLAKALVISSGAVTSVPVSASTGGVCD